jgi:hypothetical protein
MTVSIMEKGNKKNYVEKTKKGERKNWRIA